MKGLLFTYLLTYGGAAVSLFNPFVGLLIYICFAIVKPESMWYWAVPEGNYSRVVAGGLLAGWVLQGFGRWQLGRAGAITAAFLAFWGWSVLSAAQAAEAPVAWKFVEELAKVVLPFLVGITMIDSIQKVKQLVWVIVLSQGYVAFELNMSYLGGFNRVTEVGFGGMDNNSVGIAMNSCIGLAFFLGLYADRWWQKAVAFGAALLMAHVILFSFSRGGMLGLLVTGLVTFLLIPKRPAHYALFLVAALLVFRLAGAEVQKRFLSSFGGEKGQRDWSSESRLDLWSNCLDCMAKNPVFGVGPNNWGEVAPQYGWPRGKEAHTLWLQTGAELGPPGLLFLVLFYGLCAARLRSVMRRSTWGDPWPRYLASMVIASLAGFAVSAQFVSLVGLETPYYVTLIGAGVLKVAGGRAAERGQEGAPSDEVTDALPLPTLV